MKHKGEEGIASILSVIFFILMISIVTVSFLRLSYLEGRQTLADSLSKSALVAAYSGVNDAKRAMLYCKSSQGAATGCEHIYELNCPGFFGDPNLVASLGLQAQSQSGSVESIQVGNEDVNERYTCVKISSNATTIPGTIKDTNSAMVVPVEAAGDFAKIRISWDKKTVASSVPNSIGNKNPRAVSASGADASGKWDANWPAVLRVSFMSFEGIMPSNPDPASNANISERTIFMYPNSTSSFVTPRTLAKCLSVGYTVNLNGNDEQYMCQRVVSVAEAGIGAPVTNKKLYLYLSSLYKGTDYVIELLDNNDNPVAILNGAYIDSTGAVENIYRRVRVFVQFTTSTKGPLQPNAIDIGGTLCKNFGVSDSRGSFVDDCTLTPTP